MHRKFSRRQLIRVLAAVPLNASNTVLTAHTSGSMSSALRKLWSRRTQLLELSQALDEQWIQTRAKLPEWCLPGPKYAFTNGEEYGHVVGWPHARDEAILLTDGCNLARPSPADLRQLFDDETSKISPRVAKERYCHRAKALRDRMRERRELYSDVALPRTQDWERLDSEIALVEAMIAQLPPTVDVVIVRSLIELQNHRLRTVSEIGELERRLEVMVQALLDGQILNLSGGILDTFWTDRLVDPNLKNDSI